MLKKKKPWQLAVSTTLLECLLEARLGTKNLDSQYLKKKKKKRKREEEKVYSRLSQNRERGFLRERERESMDWK